MSRARHGSRVDATGRCQRRDGTGLVGRLHDVPPGDAGQHAASHRTDLDQTATDVLGPGGDVLAESDRKTNSCSDVRLGVSQPTQRLLAEDAAARG